MRGNGDAMIPRGGDAVASLNAVRFQAAGFFASRVDSDGDGVVDDLNNDGVLDEDDAFPLDPNESVDSDGDGVGDNADAFPLDPAGTPDSGGDGVAELIVGGGSCDSGYIVSGADLRTLDLADGIGDGTIHLSRIQR